MSVCLQAPATLLWLGRGRRATRQHFIVASIGDVRQSYPSLASAIDQAMRVLTQPDCNKLPWILSDGTILGPDEIRILDGRSDTHARSVLNYAA
jgi:hypothetical protein